METDFNLPDDIPVPDASNIGEIAKLLRARGHPLAKTINWKKYDQRNKEQKAISQQQHQNGKEEIGVPLHEDNPVKRKQPAKSNKKQPSPKVVDPPRPKVGVVNHDTSVFRRKCRAYWKHMPRELEKAGFVKPNFTKLSENQAQSEISSYQQEFSGSGFITVAPIILKIFTSCIETTSAILDQNFKTGHVLNLSSDVEQDESIQTLLAETVIEETNMNPMKARNRLLMRFVKKLSDRYSINKQGSKYAHILEKQAPEDLVDEFEDL